MCQWHAQNPSIFVSFMAIRLLFEKHLEVKSMYFINRRGSIEGISQKTAIIKIEEVVKQGFHLSIQIYYQFRLINSLRMEEVLINPLCLVGMTTYHTKNIPGNVGISIGLLYALQEELTYKLTLTCPLGTGTTPLAELVGNMIEYENLRLRKGKNNMNYYEEFVLVGWYVMGAEASSDGKLFSELSKAFELRGAFYSLYYFISKSVEPEPKLFKGGQQIKYKLEIDPLQKYCVDALSLQQSNKESAVVKTLNKEIHLISTYNDKISELRKKLFSPISEEKKRRIIQAIESYERLECFSRAEKQKTVEAINYSVLTGMILTSQNDSK